MPAARHNARPARDAPASANVSAMSKRIAEAERQAGDLVRFGVVAEVDLDAGRCVVTIGELTSPPLPWLAGRAGDDLTWDPPSVGEQVSVVSAEADLSAGLVLVGVFSDSVLDQVGDARGRAVYLRRFRDGSTVQFDPDAGELAVTLAGQGKARIVAPGGVEIVGDVKVTGKLEASEDVKAKTVSLVDHVHTGVQAGPGVTGKPRP